MNKYGFIMKIGSFTILLSLSISVLTVLCATEAIHAKTEVLFSPGGSINDTIIKNIRDGQDSNLRGQSPMD